MGWRLFTSPAKNIETATIGLITINPGGKDAEESRWEVPNGSAYENEQWRHGTQPGNAPLQEQIKAMFKIVGATPAESLTGYLVPFRSQSWAKLDRRVESLAFGKQIWADILAHAKLTTILAFGKDAGNIVAEVVGARDRTEYQSGWGNQTIDLYKFAAGRKLIALPHLSRFRLFNRKDSYVAENALKDIVAA